MEIMNHRLRPPTLVYAENPQTRRLRRIVDRTLSGVLMALASPVVGVACLAIYLEDRGPVLFKQKRAGRFERLFTIYKLRTMRLDSGGDKPTPKDGTDRRITRVGRVLRKTSIDELPQLFNVWRGDMTLIGPRPEMPFLVRRYENWQHMRHFVTPGLTGLWQISQRSLMPLESPQATLLDLEYIRTASPVVDGRLLFKTISSVLLAKGAY
ncbi:MAG: hypothetical protein NVS2B3_18110 [Vulcanimicrobiaceae bacterium]